MATAITLQDIMDAIDAEPEMLDALRARLLTRELIELPEKFAAFQASNIEFQKSALEFQKSTLEFQKSMLEFKAVAERRFDGMDRRFAHLTVQVGRLNGWMASQVGLDEIPSITRGMGYRYRRLLKRVELVDMTYDSDTTGIRQGDLDSFTRADAVAETTDGEGRTRYVAIEISYTAQKRDTARAIRNAEFLARFTGVPASAAVAGVQMSDEIRDEVDGGGVFWHELPMRVLQPE